VPLEKREGQARTMQEGKISTPSEAGATMTEGIACASIFIVK